MRKPLTALILLVYLFVYIVLAATIGGMTSNMAALGGAGLLCHCRASHGSSR
jgi:hypothetical protein